MNDKKKNPLEGIFAQVTDDDLLRENGLLYAENKQLQSNWNSLREWLEERIEYWENEEKKWVEQGFMKFGGEANNKIILKGLLDKMNELEGGDNGQN